MPLAFRPDLAAARKAITDPVDPATTYWLVLPALACLALAGFLFLAGGYHTGFATLNGLMPGLPPRAWSLLTALGDTGVALALFLFLLPGRWHLAWPVLLASLFGTAFTHVFKQFWPTLRPSGVLQGDMFYSVGHLSTDQSFPSGHSQTAMTFAAFVVLCFPSPVIRGLALIGGGAVAFSRVPVGMHWPIDTLVGAAGGLLCVWLALRVARRHPAGVNPGVTGLVTALSLIAAGLLLTGHPPDNPDTHMIMRGLGCVALTSFFWRVLRQR